jgi:translocation and assembly module TamA
MPSHRPRPRYFVTHLAPALLGLLLPGAGDALAQQPVLSVQIHAPQPLAQLLTENLDIVRWSERTDLTADQLQQLIDAVPEQAREVLATEGYFAPQVRTEVAGGVLRLDVEPGARVRVTNVDVQFAGPVLDDPLRELRLKNARAAWTLGPGQPFRQADWEHAKQAVVDSLAKLRYAAARVSSSRAEIDPERHEARLHVEVNSGPSYNFSGKVRIAGLQRYPQSYVLNLSPIKPGMLYSTDALLNYQRRLQTTGYFASALVSAVPDSQRPGETAVLATVVEAQARRVELGVGYSTDRGPRLQARYSDNRLLERDLQFNASLQVDRLSQTVGAGAWLPHGADLRRFGLEGRINDQDIQGEQRLDWSITGLRKLVLEKRESTQALQFLHEEVELEDGSQDSRQALFASQTWGWNTYDDPLVPREGWGLRLQIGAAARALLSTQDFARSHLQGNLLVPLGRSGTLQLRGDLGLVFAETRAGVPSAYLFRTGGSTSVRGYAYESLGVSEGNAVVGGRYLGVASVEYVHWLNRPQTWGAAVFLDAGDAVDELSDFEPAFGSGIGARWRSPVGVLALDIAYGERVEEWRVHFSASVVLR